MPTIRAAQSEFFKQAHDAYDAEDRFKYVSSRRAVPPTYRNAAGCPSSSAPGAAISPSARIDPKARTRSGLVAARTPVIATPRASQPSATQGPYFIGAGGSGCTDL